MILRVADNYTTQWVIGSQFVRLEPSKISLPRTHAPVQTPSTNMNDQGLAAEAIASLADKVDGDERKGQGSTRPVAGVVAIAGTRTLNTSTQSKEDPKMPRRKYKKRVKEPAHKFAVQPRVIQVVHKPKRYVNQ
jgi:hypothetical protein